MSKALIFGATGQDGSYLSEFLLKKGYSVHGVVRRSSAINPRLAFMQDVKFHYGDVLDGSFVHNLIAKTRPKEIYNLAAQSDVKVSFDNPEYTSKVNALGTLNILEAIRNNWRTAKFYQASSSEMFGKVQETPQTENTPFYPRSPYGVSKVFAHYLTRNYREAYGLFAVGGILYNHESPRRGEEFLSRKVTKAVARIKAGKQDYLYLGSMDPKRDWGYAPDYVEGIWQMLQQDSPDEFILATGETHSVQEFVEEAFSYAGLDWRKHVKQDKNLIRPSEVQLLVGDYSKAKEKMGWEPKTTFKQLVQIMVDADLGAEK